MLLEITEMSTLLRRQIVFVTEIQTGRNISKNDKEYCSGRCKCEREPTVNTTCSYNDKNSHKSDSLKSINETKLISFSSNFNSIKRNPPSTTTFYHFAKQSATVKRSLPVSAFTSPT